MTLFISIRRLLVSCIQAGPDSFSKNVLWDWLNVSSNHHNGLWSTMKPHEAHSERFSLQWLLKNIFYEIFLNMIIFRYFQRIQHINLWFILISTSNTTHKQRIKSLNDTRASPMKISIIITFIDYSRLCSLRN